MFLLYALKLVKEQYFVNCKIFISATQPQWFPAPARRTTRAVKALIQCYLKSNIHHPLASEASRKEATLNEQKKSSFPLKLLGSVTWWGIM